MSRRANVLALALIAAASAVLAYHTNSDWDYPEDAGPAIYALTHGRIHDFLAARPLMGPVSLLFRAPFATLANLTGDDFFFNNAYRFGVFPCMVAIGVFGLWLAGIARERRQPQLIQAALVALVMVNPVTLKAIQFGHPEEVLAAALSAGAVLAGLRGRPWLASIVLALAIGTKQWAVLAIVPVALTLAPRELRRAGMVALGLVAVFVVPLLVVDPGSLWTTTRSLADVKDIGVLPTSIWWPFTGSVTTPRWIGLIAHPLIVFGGSAVALLYARRIRASPLERALPLLALLLLLRCVLDPVDNSYYQLPWFVAVVAADAVSGSLSASLFAVAGLWITGKLPAGNSALLSAFYFSWALPFGVYLAGRAYGLDWPAILRSRGALGRGAEPSPPPSAAGARSPAAR